MSFAAAALLLAFAAPQAPGSAAPARALRYDLQPGDRLVYHQWIERRVQGAAFDSLSEAEWDTQVLVLAERGGSWRVGIQRNRTRAELLRYREDGHDRREAERGPFLEALARRGTAFAEANWLTVTGGALLPWSAVREVSSERLPFVHEVEPLPASAVAPGGSFPSPGLIAIPMRAIGLEMVAGEECLRLEGEGAEGALRIRQWHCPGTGTLGRLEYEARYGGPGGNEVSERFRLERVSRTRGEDPAAWLRGASTARGALTALAVSDHLVVTPEALYGALDGAEPETARLVLAVAWRHRLPPPPTEALRPLVGSPSVPVRTLAVRLLELRPDPEAGALREKALSDEDPFVRAAAAPHPPASEELVSLARVVRGSGPLPEWSGRAEAGWGRAALLAQRAPGQVPGTTLRLMRTPRFRGRPYVLRVPDDYRGDEPFPIVIVLGGGPGRALPTAQTARASLDGRGEIALFPQANGMWWEPEPTAAVAALLAEVLADLDIDTDRVTLTGFSNGGTGSFLYASLMPDRFAAVASLMGGGLPFFERTEPIDPAAVARMPVLFVHGSRDSLIPPWASERTVKALRKVNPEAEAELHVLPGRPHDIVYGQDEGLTFPFLERHTRDPFPRRVFLRARSLDHPRAFWVEVLGKDGGVAEVDAWVEGAAITLRTRNVKRLRLRLSREIVDLSAPLRVTLDGKEAFAGPVTEAPALLLRSWRETGDPQLAYSAEIVLDVK